MTEPTAFPLCWPEGWHRTAPAVRSNPLFKKGGNPLTVATACDRVFEELDRLCVSHIIISTNVEPTLSGRPRSSKAEPADPGVAVYWQSTKGPRCMAVDRYATVAGNLAALAATLEAFRAIERHGGAAFLDRAFTGFAQLPPPSDEAWWNVLGLSRDANKDQIKRAARKLLAEHHPEGPAPDAALFEAVARARDEALQAVSQ